MGQPPDATIPAYDPSQPTVGFREVTMTVRSSLFDAIKESINALPDAPIEAREANKRMGEESDNKYVSAFMGYHSVWYSLWAPNCKVGFHTHVDYGIALCQVMLAFDRQMAELIAWLNKN